MKALSFLFAVLLAAPCRADDAQYLNLAILGLPPKYFADVPEANRQRILQNASTDEGKTPRLDYASGFFHWYSDSPEPELRAGTSQIYLKLLPRDGKSPLVFVHLPKPFAANGGEPANNQTFILECDLAKRWMDVTSQVMPKDVDLTMHFRPQRKSLVVEVAAWKKFRRTDVPKDAYTYGERVLDLRWENGKFVTAPPAAKELSRE